MATPAEARAGYEARIMRVDSRIRWFDRQVVGNMNIALSRKLDLVAQLMRDKIVANISLPVRRYFGPRGGKRVERSLPGEFPRLETARLRNDIFWDKKDELTRIVGTSLDYGVYLEVNMNRSFLRRTLNEEQTVLRRVLTQRLF